MKKHKSIIKKKDFFTIVIIPSSKSRPIQFNLSPFFLFFIIGIFLGIVGVSVYVLSRKIVFNEVLRANVILKKKTNYFAKRVNESLDLVKQVHDLNTQLRGLLALGNRRKVMEYSGMGGPGKLEDINLSYLLFDNSKEIIDMNIKELRREAWNEFQDYKDIASYLAEKRSIAAHTPSLWPVFGRLTAGFGWRINPILKRREFHNAFDIANLKGTPIRATGDGRVVMAGWAGRLGKTVVIDHGYGYTTYYGHCDKLYVK